MNTPYNTGKVRIGARFEVDRRPTLGSDELRLQRALIGPGGPSVGLTWTGDHLMWILAAIFAAFTIYLFFR